MDAKGEKMRIVVEFDKLDKRRARKVARRLYALTGKAPEINITSTGRGFGFIVGGLPITLAHALWIRRKCGDDKTHIRFDAETNYKPKNIMWTAKRVKSCPEKSRLAPFLGQKLTVTQITYKELM